MKKTIKLTPQRIRLFQQRIYAYYQKNKRALPWRRTHDPYKIILSELMLQQTQVKRVIEKYRAFLRRFPSIESLARAPLHAILEQWQELGYNRRALALKRLAGIIVDRHGGRIPRKIEVLKTLPGVGAATAGAVCAFAFDRPVVFIETNIRSVFIHFFFRGREAVKDSEILPLIAQTMDAKRPREWYYALMDYGASLKERHPNPNRRSAHYARQSPFEGSRRQVRGKILRVVVAHPGISEVALVKEINRDKEMVRHVLEQLREEGFIGKKGRRFFIHDR